MKHMDQICEIDNNFSNIQRIKRKNGKKSRRDTISELPDELLFKILSSMPCKYAVSTSVLSKRWRFLWEELKTFKYEATESRVATIFRFTTFISTRSKVDSLQLKLNPNFLDYFIYPLVNSAVDLSLRELRIEMLYNSFRLNKSLYKLETLILEKLSLDDVQHNVRLTCLKTLHLLSVKFSSDQSLKTFLSICPRLEDLVVRRTSYNTNLMIFTIDVPTLRSLSIDNSSSRRRRLADDVHGFVINAPSLRRFSIRDSFSNYLRFQNMPELVKTSLHVVVCDFEIFEWRQYKGTEQEREAAKYILANAYRLNKATFHSQSVDKHRMFKELEYVAIGSKTCQLVFE